MKCPHCRVEFFPEPSRGTITGHSVGLSVPLRVPLSPKTNENWSWKATVCPRCKKHTIWLCETMGDGSYGPEYMVYPRSSARSVSELVPEALRTDYAEACEVLPISPKASAALSRRVLQAILSEQGYEQKDLAKQIDDVRTDDDPAKALPTPLRDTIDAIRNFGNFSAHRITDKTTLQIIDVDPEEAEWLSRDHRAIV